MASRDGKSDRRDSAGSDAELAQRLDQLSHALDAERKERAETERPMMRASGTDFAYAFRLASEFVAGILVGAALGWGIDRLAGTSPWGLISFLMLGFVAGVLNVVRASSRLTGGGSGQAG
jgi:ATP synthase protein I